MVAYASFSLLSLSLSHWQVAVSAVVEERNAMLTPPVCGSARWPRMRSRERSGRVLKQNNMEPSMHGFIQSTAPPKQLGAFVLCIVLVRF